MFVKQMNMMMHNFAKQVVEHIETEEEDVTVEMMMEQWNKFFQVKGARGKGGKGTGVKRGPTGYLLFCKAQREKKARCLKDLDFIETSKKLGQMWRGLSDKKREEWNAKAKEANAAGAKSSDDEKPKAKSRSRGKRADSDDEVVVKGGKGRAKAKTVDLTDMSCSDLKAMCKERELKGYSSLKKAELIALLTEGEKKTKSRRRKSKTPEEEEEVVESEAEESGDEFDEGSDEGSGDEGSGEEEEEEEEEW